MVAAAAFLAILDAVILSATPDATRIAFAVVVTFLAGGAILMIWRSNTRLEKSAEMEKKPSGEGKAADGGRQPDRRKR